MLSQFVKHRKTIGYLALHQFRDRYSGTIGGVLWAVAHPVLLLIVFWIVFEQGMKVSGSGQQPFVLSLFCALVPWMTFSETLGNAASAITGRSFMVKKIAFPSEILPASSLVASLLTHAVLLVLLALILAWYGRVPSWGGLLLLPYYLAGMCVFAFALGLALSAINVFFRDVGQSLQVMLNVWFWITPIVWPAESLPARFSPILTLNPLYYIVHGYRSALLEDGVRLPPLGATLYFWVLTLALLVLGVFIFRRLKPYFADAL